MAEPLDSPPEGAEPGPDDNEEPDTSRDFDQLRQLLVGTEQQRLRKLEDRVDRFAVTADAVGDVLAEAIAETAAFLKA